MASARSIVRAKATTSLPPAESFTQANALICADAARGMFITVFYAELDTENRTLTYVNCGHNSPFWYKAAQGNIQELSSTGPVIGMFESMQCKQQQIEMSSGDVLLLYTDGITEGFNENEQEFGDERLKAVLTKHAQKSPPEILSEIKTELEAFVGSAPQSDDRTIVLIKCL